MIPNTDYGETITSGKMETGAASIEMTPEMFTLLSSGMYTDKILAAIRETTCNARDIQVETEDGVPLGMHLPTRLEPFYHIRDYGTGLTERQVLGYTETITQFNPETGHEEQVKRHVPGLYLRYGKSTKRDSNLQIGGFGIGCKSPLAYSESFIVESYQNGTVKTYTVYKEKGMPKIAKLNEKLTTEQDGLKVKIAVVNSDIDSFAKKAANFLRHFGYPVDITGQSITHKVKYILQTDLYDTVESDWGDRGKICASMGGVIYNVSTKYKEELEQIAQGKMLIMKFKIGELSVAGSREALSEDEDTIKKLEVAVARIKSEFYAVMQKEVEKPEHTLHQAYQLLSNYNLLKQDVRTDAMILKKGLSFTIRGEDANVVLERLSRQTFRTINEKSSSGDINCRMNSYKTVPHNLEIYLGSGYLKVAKEMSRQSAGESRVVLAGDANDIRILKEYFGNDIEIDKVSVKYEEYFPKGAPTAYIKVAASGLFNTNRAEIRQLEVDQEGWYMPFERGNCLLKGKPSCYTEFREINRVVISLMEAGQIDEKTFFYARKGGMRAIKRTKLKEITWAEMMIMARKCYTKQDYLDHVFIKQRQHGNPAINKHKSLQALWDKVKHNYPTWAGTQRVIPPSIGRVFLGDSHLGQYLELTYATDMVAEKDKYNKEQKQFDLDYPILNMFSSYWRLTEDMVTDIIAFCDWKTALMKVTIT